MKQAKLEKLLTRNPFEEKIDAEIRLAEENLQRYTEISTEIINDLMNSKHGSMEYEKTVLVLLNKINEMSNYVSSVLDSIQSNIAAYSKSLAMQLFSFQGNGEIVGSQLIEMVVENVKKYLEVKNRYGKELQNLIKKYDDLVIRLSSEAKKFDKELFGVIMYTWMLNSSEMIEDYVNVQEQQPEESSMYM